jgi:hypothetical protein
MGIKDALLRFLKELPRFVPTASFAGLRPTGYRCNLSNEESKHSIKLKTRQQKI